MTRFSEDFQNILKKYEKHKIQTYEILQLIGDDYSFNKYGADTKNAVYASMVNCGTQLFFTKCLENGNFVYHLTGANFCRLRICPMCQFRKAEKMFVETLQVVKQLEENFRFLHLVLTVPNVETGGELIDTIDSLYKGFNRFWKFSKIKKAYKGCVRCLEISYNYQNSTFHPHLHCLIAVNPSYFTDSRIYLNTKEVQLLWSKAMQSETLLQVYHRAIKKGDYKGVAEICKYCVKPLELKENYDVQNRTIVLTLFQTLKGKRFVQRYGVLKEQYKILFNDDNDEYLDFIKEDIHQRIFINWDSKNLFYMKGD